LLAISLEREEEIDMLTSNDSISLLKQQRYQKQ